MDPKQPSPPSFQQLVADFVAENGLDAPAPARLLDLVSEVGELAKEVLIGSDYGRVPFEPPETWADELADCFFSFVCLANSTGVDLGQGLEGALAKYRDRVVRRGDAGSGR